MRAGDLAMKARKIFAAAWAGEESEEEGEDGDPLKRIQLLQFLWSVENLRMTKVSLSQPPDNNIFNCFVAQQTMSKLDKEEISTKEKSREKEGLPSNERLQHPKWQSTRTSQSSLPSDRHEDSQKDKTQSEKQPTAPPTGQPLQNFATKGEQKKEREKEEMWKNEGRKGGTSRAAALQTMTQAQTLPNRATRNPRQNLPKPIPDPKKRSLPQV
jgi:hypothetical protein